MSAAPSPVGVVVLNYRGADDTEACVASLRAARWPLRIVVVDNGSGDGSIERLRAIEGVELIESATNLGFAGGNNLGLRHLLDDPALELLWVLNNDTLVPPGAIEALVAFASADPRLGAVSPVLVEADDPDRVLTWGGGALGRWTARTTDARGPEDRVDYLTGAALLLRAQALREVGLLDERYFFTWEDIDLSRRLEAAGWRLGVAPEARVAHRWGGTAEHLSPFRVREHMAGATRFQRSAAPIGALAAVPLLGYYGARAALDRDLGTWRAAWAGWRAGRA